MNRVTHAVVQGTGPWLRLREGFLTASEAPAALGVSKYVTRAELMRRKHTGIAEEHSAATLGKFAAGHAAEDRARPLAEGLIDDVLYPVTMSVEVGGLKLLASLDGLTLDDAIAWETKLWNEGLAEQVRTGNLEPHYTVQMDQELLVSGAQRCLFTCTDGTPERFVSCWYEASQERFDALVSGWIQFEKDLSTYTLPSAGEPVPAGKAPETLPALRIEVTGQVTASNLAEFKQTAMAAIGSVNRTLTTDADFADASASITWCSDVESRLKAAKEHALSQTSSIDALFKTIDDISAEARRVRLDLNTLVTRRKTEVKEEAVLAARKALDAHIATLNAELAPMRLQAVLADFPGAIKGLRSISSMQDALDTMLAGGKIVADQQARGIRANVATFKAAAEGLEFLFADLGQIVHKAADDFGVLLRSRIDAHRAAEAEKVSKQAEAEAARIAQAEQRAREQEAARIAELQAVELRKTEEVAERARKLAAYLAQREASLAEPVVAVPAIVVQQAEPVRVAPAQAPASVNEPATLNLGAIEDRLGFALRANFITGRLGIDAAAFERGVPRFRESQFPLICAALVAHIDGVLQAA